MASVSEVERASGVGGGPGGIRTAVVAQAEADQKAGWKALLATTFLDFKRNGNRRRFEADSFGRRAMLQRLILAECLEGKGHFVDDIANGVWLICEETFWGAPAHLDMQKAGVGLPDVSDPIIELFSAETAQLLAWTNYLLGAQLDQVSPLVNKRIMLEAEHRMLKLARERNDFTWMGLGGPKQDRRLNNWTPWINSNLLVANLILEEDPKLRITGDGEDHRSLDAYLNHYWPDAGEEEGPGYFSGSAMCYFEVVEHVGGSHGQRHQHSRQSVHRRDGALHSQRAHRRRRLCGLWRCARARPRPRATCSIASARLCTTTTGSLRRLLCGEERMECARARSGERVA